MDILRATMEMGSFWTLWYWIAHAVTWSLVSHFAMGVPFDMIIRANRENDDTGPWSQATDAVIRAQVFRYAELSRQYGVFLAGVISFLLAMLLTFSIRADLELARAFFCLLGPLTLIYILSARRAEKLSSPDLSPRALRAGVRRQRLWNQAIGVLAISMSVALAVWEYLRHVTQFWQ